MHDDESKRGNAAAREIHEMAYLKHKTGASEAEIREMIEKVGSNRAKIERELRRPKMLDC